MKNFYKIVNNKAVIGSTKLNKIPQGFIEYTLGEEPQELLEAIAFKSDKDFNLEIDSQIEKLEKEDKSVTRKLILDLLNGRTPNQASKAQLQKTEDDVKALKDQRK